MSSSSWALSSSPGVPVGPAPAWKLGLSPGHATMAIVATYPSAGGRRGCIFHGRKMRRVSTNVYSRKTSEKPERCGLWTLIVKGLGVVFTHGEGISTPHVRHKGRQPLIECARHDFKIMYFPFFYVFMYFSFFYVFFLLFVGLFVFFIFSWSIRVFPSLLRILNCDEEIKPT